ncbi:hypothetical protein ACIRO1_45965 [Streptomyces sp. NPDC102381]|uniref:hypothetical protein n=1 Tax=Streptomyces sp. NPDC102381 TaxID=3366164 RepID=UPI0037F9BC21
MPFTKSQIERLGRRLVEQTPPAEADLDDLAVLLNAYDEALDAASDTLRELGSAPTGRLKNTGTILEKLRRHGGSWLKSIQDLAGLRIVVEGGLADQDRVAGEILQRFADCPKPPKKIDRRADPRQGYRAVHVIVFPDGMPVEVQIRTVPQHMWAELFEKLADLLGRGIRYGEDFEMPGERQIAQLRTIHPEPELDEDFVEIVGEISETKRLLRDLVKAFLDLSEQIGLDEESLDNPEFEATHEDIRQELKRLFEGMRPLIDQLESFAVSTRTSAHMLVTAVDADSAVGSDHD